MKIRGDAFDQRGIGCESIGVSFALKRQTHGGINFQQAVDASRMQPTALHHLSHTEILSFSEYFEQLEGASERFVFHIKRVERKGDEQRDSAIWAEVQGNAQADIADIPQSYEKRMNIKRL